MWKGCGNIDNMNSRCNIKAFQEHCEITVGVSWDYFYSSAQSKHSIKHQIQYKLGPISALLADVLIKTAGN